MAASPGTRGRQLVARLGQRSELTMRWTNKAITAACRSCVFFILNIDKKITNYTIYL